MPRQQVKLEFNNFVKGIITEVNPLTFPENASLDEQNLELNRDGTRNRRLGLGLENSTLYHTVNADLNDIPITSFIWKEAKGAGKGDVVCVQTGNALFFFDGSKSDLSDNMLRAFDLSEASDGSRQVVDIASFSKLGGKLLVAHGGVELSIFEYNSVTSLVERKQYRLKIRDLYGVGDLDTDGTDMNEGIGLIRRPTTLLQSHIYNLRNQGWSNTFISKHLGVKEDPIYSWFDKYSDYPANSDVITRALHPDTSDDDNPTIDRFWEENLHDKDYGSTEPPKGSFVIDFIRRSASRLEQVASMEEERDLKVMVEDLPFEKEDSSASCLETYSGRVFYAGFPGSVSENSTTPDTQSLVLFSQLIKNDSSYGNCYQEGDPTSPVEPDLVDTDGGVIQLEDASNIQSLVTNSKGLVAIAGNGVWLITGGSGYGFSATNYMVSKITDRGSISPTSVVKVKDDIMYWSDEGIQLITTNNYGDLVVQNITENTIQTLYEDLDYRFKLNVKGSYDPYEGKVRWLIGDQFPEEGSAVELVLDLNLSAFTKNVFDVHKGQYSVLDIVRTPPYTTSESRLTITADGSKVTSLGTDVYVSSPVYESNYTGVKYLIARRISENEGQITFGLLNNVSFKDWESVDGEGIDAPAFLTTGYINAGDNMRKKQLFKLTSYMRKTERGFYEDSTGNVYADNPSSCILRGMWDWSNGSVSGKWSEPIQLYRHRREWIPESATDEFDNGESLVVTSSKLRGRGRVLSLKFETEPEKDFNLLGWSMFAGVNNGPRGN